MPSKPNHLGIMKPVGGGDPVPLRKNELVVGRRPSCDVCLDFENVSGKHCLLKFTNQVWHVRDLGSTNGTRLNGVLLSTEHTVMPDDELGISGHIYTIDYEPGAPQSILLKEQLIDDDISEAPKRHSLMELAGLDTDGDRPTRSRRSTRSSPVDPIERPSADEADFDDPVIAPEPAGAPSMKIETTDDDFLSFIEEDIRKARP